MKAFIGTDVGGTFTDQWVADDGGKSEVIKSFTTDDVLGGVINAVTLAAQTHFAAGLLRINRKSRTGHHRWAERAVAGPGGEDNACTERQSSMRESSCSGYSIFHQHRTFVVRTPPRGVEEPTIIRQP